MLDGGDPPDVGTDGGGVPALARNEREKTRLKREECVAIGHRRAYGHLKRELRPYGRRKVC